MPRKPSRTEGHLYGQVRAGNAIPYNFGLTMDSKRSRGRGQRKSSEEEGPYRIRVSRYDKGETVFRKDYM